MKAKKNGNYCVIQIDANYVPADTEKKQVFGVTFEQGHNFLKIDEQSALSNIVTKNKNLSEDDKRNLIISLIVLKYTQSNSVCFVKDGQAIGIGAGQQSRVHCTRLAGQKADNWWLRQCPKVLNLQFVDGIKRADRDNAIDVYIGEEYMDCLAEGNWQRIFKVKPEIFTAEEKRAWLDKMTDEELFEAVNNYQVYARISPSAKLRIVEALQANGYVVAMTGDGVNDAPAIQKADIGIGMGITGTKVVKKVADCILIDDSFSTIVDGVEEGRRITSNIKKIIMYLLAGNIIEVILVFVSMLLNMEMFTTLQLLWINLVTDSIPAIMLAFEKGDKSLMENTPDNRNNISFFTPFLIARIVMGAILKSVIMLAIFYTFSKIEDVNIASSLLFIYLIIHELLFALSCRNIKKSVINKDIFNNKHLTIL